MRKEYESPEVEIVQFKLSDVLTVSEDETPASSGFIEEPDPDLPDEGI